MFPLAMAVKPTPSPTSEMLATLVQKLAAVFAPAAAVPILITTVTTATAAIPPRLSLNTGLRRALPPPADIQLIPPVVLMEPQAKEIAPTASETVVASFTAVVSAVLPVPVECKLVQVATSHGSALRDNAKPDSKLVVLEELESFTNMKPLASPAPPPSTKPKQMQRTSKKRAHLTILLTPVEERSPFKRRTAAQLAIAHIRSLAESTGWTRHISIAARTQLHEQPSSLPAAPQADVNLKLSTNPKAAEPEASL